VQDMSQRAGQDPGAVQRNDCPQAAVEGVDPVAPAQQARLAPAGFCLDPGVGGKSGTGCSLTPVVAEICILSGMVLCLSECSLMNSAAGLKLLSKFCGL
jgi:hypothetical protein